MTSRKKDFLFFLGFDLTLIVFIWALFRLFSAPKPVEIIEEPEPEIVNPGFEADF